MYERIGIPKGASPLVVSKEGGVSREENCGRRTVGVDMKDITGFPSAAILHNAKLHKRFFIAPKWEIYRLRPVAQVSNFRNLKRTDNKLSP